MMQQPEIQKPTADMIAKIEARDNALRDAHATLAEASHHSDKAIRGAAQCILDLSHNINDRERAQTWLTIVNRAA